MNNSTRFTLRKQTVWALSLILVFSLILAACSSNNGGNSSESPTPTNAGGAVNGGNNQESPTETPLDPVTLKWFVRQSEPNNADSVLAAVNEKLQEKINTMLEVEFVNPGDYDSRMQLVMSSGEEYDLSFASTWTNSFLNNVSRGAYLPLDEYVDKYPGLKNLFRDEIWEAVRIEGSIYAIPNKQIMNSQPGYWFRQDLVDKHQLDVNSVQSFEDLEAVLQTIKDNETNISPAMRGIYTTFMDYYPKVVQFSGDDWLRVDPETLKVIDDSEMLLERYKLMRKWNQQGFFPQDVATLKNQNELIKAGRIFSDYSRFKPGAAAELKGIYGLDFVFITAGDPVIAQGSVQSTLTTISSTSKNPERAAMLLELINTDKELYNLFTFGLEDQDYKKVSDNRIEQIEGGYYLTNWMVGNVFNSYLLPGQEDDVWEVTEQMDNEAIVDPLISFVFDRMPVQNEMARLSATAAEYTPVFQHGLADPEQIFPEYRAKMEASGLDKVIAEVEKQLAEWKALQ